MLQRNLLVQVFQEILTFLPATGAQIDKLFLCCRIPEDYTWLLTIILGYGRSRLAQIYNGSYFPLFPGFQSGMEIIFVNPRGLSHWCQFSDFARYI